MQIIDNLLFEDNGAYNAMRLIGLSDHPFDMRDTIPTNHKINASILNKFDKKNRVYREYETILFTKKQISNEFGQK